jgi:hypothetical protein
MSTRSRVPQIQRTSLVKLNKRDSESDCIVCGTVLRAGAWQVRLAYNWDFCESCLPQGEELVAILQSIVWSRTEGRSCEGKTKDGLPCRRRATYNQLYCSSHLPRSVKERLFSMCKAYNGNHQPCGCYAISGTGYCYFHVPGHVDASWAEIRHWRQAYHAKVERSRHHPE